MKRDSLSAGFSLLEILVVLGLMGIVAAMASSSIKEIERPLSNTAFNVSHFLRLARSRAISQTLAIKVAPLTNKKLGASSATSCTGTMTAMNNLSVALDSEIELTSTSWSICFNQRGLADNPVSFVIRGSSGTKTIQVALGGGVKVN